MEKEALIQEIETLIAELGDEVTVAKPKAEHRVVSRIHQLLELTRENRTGSSRAEWEKYLPYATKLCDQLSHLEEGWQDDLELFASENSQFWLDNASAFLDESDISGVIRALGQVSNACRLMKHDRIQQVEILLRALDLAIEISDKKLSLRLYEEAEKLYRKQLVGGSEYTGSIWGQKIKRIGQQITLYGDKLRRYFMYAETVTFAIEAASQEDTERVINYLQQGMPGKIKVTRQVKESDELRKTGSGGYRARLKIIME